MGGAAMKDNAKESAFHICDEDGDGKLDKGEFLFWLRALGANPTVAEIDALPKDKIDLVAAEAYFAQFKAAHNNSLTPAKDPLIKLFEIWDPTNSGIISFEKEEESFTYALQKIGRDDTNYKSGDPPKNNMTKAEIETLRAEATELGCLDGDKFKYKDF